MEAIWCLTDVILFLVPFHLVWGQQWRCEQCKGLHIIWSLMCFMCLCASWEESGVYWCEGQEITPRVPAVLAFGWCEIMSQIKKYQKISRVFFLYMIGLCAYESDKWLGVLYTVCRCESAENMYCCPFLTVSLIEVDCCSIQSQSITKEAILWIKYAYFWCMPFFG